MLQLWTISNLQRLDYSIRQKITFYAPLTEHIDFYGIDPCTYSWSGSSSVTFRGGARTITGPAPNFNFSGDTPNGIYVNTGVTLQFNAANGLNNANTLVWFENRVPKSTPTQTNPFNSGGTWTGTLNTYVSHIAKANAVLANSEINAIQAALLDVIQTIPAPPPAPPLPELASLVTETPSGTRDDENGNGAHNVTFTTSQNVDLTKPVWLTCFGGTCERVGSSPAEQEFTMGSTGNRTITMGMAPRTSYPFVIKYFTA